MAYSKGATKVEKGEAASDLLVAVAVEVVQRRQELVNLALSIDHTKAQFIVECDRSTGMI